MQDINDEKRKRYTRMNQVHSSYHDCVCYLAVENETGLQVFWYEFINDIMTESDIEKGFKQLQKSIQVTSPHLMNILNVWKTSVPSRFYVITEATQAPSLFDYLHSIESPPPTRTLIKWFKKLTLAVQALHHAQIIHGSISLQNALIKPATGTLKLRFPLTNLSCRLISSVSLDINQYTSPEHLSGSPSMLSDVWSLGIAFLELLTQKSAYEEFQTPQELITAINSMKLPQSLNLVKDQAAASLIQKCLSSELMRPTVDEILKDTVFNLKNEKRATQSPENLSGSIQIIVQNDKEESAS
ncbi:protein kinase [Tritrichomonas foetus]|uniref:Protein kinase n=1 Tax=Tritrichomonas foetus TaxID=1144522 RepID=A0A1J4JT60_9EUKA|nr:protein kinase [Tritrichomonas foetus]|eukprot:OHT00684.1 protein kinase [Tritrichomonas foetus]